MTDEQMKILCDGLHKAAAELAAGLMWAALVLTFALIVHGCVQ